MFPLNYLVRRLRARIYFHFQLFNSGRRTKYVFVSAVSRSRNEVVKVMNEVIFRVPNGNVRRHSNVISISKVCSRPYQFISRRRVIVFMRSLCESVFERGLRDPQESYRRGYRGVLQFRPMVTFRQFTIYRSAANVNDQLCPIAHDARRPICRRFVRARRQLPTVNRRTRIFVRLEDLVFALFQLWRIICLFVVRFIWGLVRDWGRFSSSLSGSSANALSSNDPDRSANVSTSPLLAFGAGKTIDNAYSPFYGAHPYDSAPETGSLGSPKACSVSVFSGPQTQEVTWTYQGRESSASKVITVYRIDTFAMAGAVHPSFAFRPTVKADSAVTPNFASFRGARSVAL